MLNRESHHLDAAEIGRNRSLWRPIPRVQALMESRGRTVAVIHRGPGRDTVTLFQPSNRFYRANGPYLYDGLRYFLYVGPGGGPDYRLSKSLGMASKPPEGEMEPLEFEDQATGEFRSMGSPPPKIPQSPTVPKPPGLSDRAGLALDIAGRLQGLPAIPGGPEIPDLPTLDIPIMPQVPGIPDFALDPVPKEIIPIEFQLLDDSGVPRPPTAFQLTLPDGTVKDGESDADGFIRVPDNVQRGETTLLLLSESDALAAKEKAAAEGKTFPVEILLLDAKGKPLPETAFRLTFPNGTMEEGLSDGEGFIRFPDNRQPGEMELVLVGDGGGSDEERLA